MKKQGTGKKGLTWLLIGIGALILVAAVVLGIVLLGGAGSEPGQQVSDKPVLYWNVERSQYVGQGPDGISGRNARSDGYYYVRFAVGGEQIDYQVADYNLVQKIDQLDLMGLEFDEQGVIVGVKNVNECTGGLVANPLYVQSVEGNTLICNTQGLFKGLSVEVEMTEDTQVYDVGQTGLLCGMAAEVGVDDEILAVKDYDGKIIYIFTRGYQEPGDVYWNITRKYDSVTKMTTRETDALGYYVFEMAFNGEVVTVKTRDLKIASSIDAKAARCTGLEFDEEGNVSAVTNASRVAGGTTFASWANVFELNGDEVYAVKLTGSLTGTEYFGTLAKNCKVINVSGVGGEMGSYTTLQYGDQVHGLTDSRGRICYIWVISRLATTDGWQLYWNVERQYDSTAKVTKRTPAADGYYYIDVATGGEQFTVKTKDKEIVTKLDSYAARCFSMKLDENNEIVKVGGASQIHGGSTFGSWYYVDKIDGRKLTVSRILSGDTEPTIMEGVMAEDVEIINGSTVYSSHCGEYSELKVGDRIHGLKDLNGNIRVIFIVEKTVSGPLYWNIAKKTVKNGMTTRERAEDGYFYFTMAGGGKQYTFKTKDAELATKIDSYAAKCMGLTVTGSGIITKVHSATAVNGCQGGTKSLSWVDVTSVSGRSLVAKKNQAGHAQDGQIFTTKMASNCKVYNVSSNFNLFCGEETTVRVGDRIHVLHDRNGSATVVFVVERQKSLTEKNACPCDQNVTWEPWDGTTALENGKYYYLTKDVTAPAEGFVLEGISVSIRLDGHTISSDGRCFFVKSGSMLNICDHGTRGKLIGSGVNDESGGVIRVYSSTCTVNLWNIDLERKDGETMAKEGGLISCSGTVSLYNCNLTGGEASSRGGNVQISSSGTFRMFGGSVTGGAASTGSSLNVAGRTYLEDVTITGGSGNTINFNCDKEMVVNGLTADKAYVAKESVTLMGDVQIGSLTLAEGAVLVDGGINPGSKITLTAKPADSWVVMTGASEAGYKALTSFDPDDYKLSYDAGKKTVTVTCTIEPKTHTNNHCACAGNASGLGDHTCTNLTGWTELTADILVDSPTAGNLAFPASGNYYLSLDMELTKSIDILPDQQITLCLNGCELTGTKRIFRVNGTLNITDCSGKGEIVGQAALAPVFYGYSGGTINLYGGTLSTDYAGKSSYWGGVGALANDAGNAAAKGSSTMNMYGGTILGGNVVKDGDGKNGNGGAITMFYSSHANTFTMYGGTITGGSAENQGGNLNAPNMSIVNLLGGTITGGTCEKGADVYVGATAEATLGGSMKIGQLYLPDSAMLQLQALTSDASIGILMANAGAFAEYAEDVSKSFTSIDDTYEVVHSGGKLKLDLNSSVQGHIHCICGGTANGLHQHDCTNIIYEAWDKTDSLPTTSGNYYLTEDVHLTNTEGHKIGANTINLCLNGHKITGDGRLIWVNSGSGTLNICDHAGNSGSLEAPGVADDNAGGLIRHGTGGAHVGLYNITMRRTDTEGTRNLVKEGGIVSCSGYLDMYNVTMENGYAKKAGNLLVALTSKVVMVNCTIKDGTSTTDTGGNIHIGGSTASNPATVTMIDCSITGGTSGKTGDGVNLGSANSELHLGGKITITDNDGQNLYMAGSGNLYLFELASDSKIGITMSSAGVISQSADDLSDCFLSDKTGLNVYYDADAQEIYLADQEREETGESTEPSEPEPSEPAEPKVHQDHCVCGTHAKDMQDHSCETISWQPLPEGTTDLTALESGNYYLTKNITVEKATYIGSGTKNSDGKSYKITATKDINICLNGFDIETTSSRTFGQIYNGSSLSITDCGEESKWGTITGGSNTYGSIVYTYAMSELNIYGGNFTNTYTSAANDDEALLGGLIAVAQDRFPSGGSNSNGAYCSTFNLYGGNLYDGVAGGGGNVYVMHASVFNMYGGEITNGTQRSVTRNNTTRNTGGGNIYIDTNTVFNMYGGVISGGSSAIEGDNIFAKGKLNIFGGSITDGDVYVLNDKKLTVGAMAQIEEVYLAEDVTLAISTEKPLTGDASIGISMVNAEKAFATVSDESVKNYFFNVANKNNSILYQAADKGLYLVNEHIHCLCEGAEAKPEGHECENITWVALTQKMFDEATDASSPVKLTSDGYVLDNGGHYYLSEDITIKKTLTPGEGNAFSLCLNGKTLKGDGVRTIYFKGTLNLCDCDYTDELVDEETVRIYNGSVVSNRKPSSNSHAAVAYPRSGGVLNLFGGNLTDSTSDTAKTGAIVYVSGEMNMYGGKISDGNTSAEGGNLCIADSGIVRMYGGEISDGTSVGNGGNIIINSSATLELHGGLITGGTAGTSGKYGGNIRVNGKMVMDGGVISHGTAGEGGNITVGGNGTLRILGGVVENGSAVSGGNISVSGKLSVEENAIVRDGISTGTGATAGGGNIYGYPNNTEIQITGGQILNGKAQKNGANIHVRPQAGKTCELSITGGSISGIHADSGADVHSVSIYYPNNAGTMDISVGGNAQIDELYLGKNRTITIADTGITKDARIGISKAEGTGTVIETVDTTAEINYTEIFYATQEDKKTAISGSSLVIE